MAPSKAAILALSLILSAPALAGGGSEGPFRVLAGPYNRKEVKAGVGHTRATALVKGLSIAVEYLEPPARAAFVRTIDPTLPDPFAPRTGHPEIYTTYRVAFDNQSPADVQFQAGNVVLITDRKTQDFPVDLTDLYRVAAEVGVANPEGAVDRIKPVMFDDSTTIRKGEKVERMLVFGPFPEKWKALQIHFSFLEIGTETHTVSFNFHKQPIPE